MQLKVSDILKICNGKYLGTDNLTLNSFSKDTRSINIGDTYIGIKGNNFNGNNLYQEALNNGSNACILDNDTIIEGNKLPIILVDDTVKAIKQIASYIRENSDAMFIGVTGSVGKTSTKEMIYNVLSKKYDTLKTIGNYNNYIGLPLTLMRLKDEKAAVIEMGMNNLGEIRYLSKIARPIIGVITNVGTSHIGKLGSRQNILKAKLEILDGMNEDSTLIINNDNDLLHEYYLNNKDKNIITIGIENESDIMAYDIDILDTTSFKIKYKNNSYSTTIKIPSKSYIYNALIGFAIGIKANIPIYDIMNSIKEYTPNRLNIIEKNGIKIIDDSYNASVESMKSSLEYLKNILSKRKIALLGDMLELGNYSKKLHEKVGNYVTENQIDYLITVGKYAKYIAKSAKENNMLEDNIYSYDNNLDATNKLKRILKKDDCLLVKASNAMKFTDIVEELKK